MIRLLGVFMVIPITMILTVSFFVMFASQKTDKKGLQSFGKVVAILLWICAGLIFCAGVFTITTGHHPMFYAMKGMHGKCPMMHGMGGKCCEDMMDECMKMKGECKMMKEKGEHMKGMSPKIQEKKK